MEKDPVEIEFKPKMEELEGEWKTTKPKVKKSPKKKQRKKKGNFHKMRAAIDPELKETWVSIQEEIRTQIIEEDDPGFDYDKIQYIAGFDVSLSNEEGFEHLAIASMCVMKFPSLEVIYDKDIERSHDVPYCPGFLAFKELPAMKELYQIFQTENPDIKLDFILVDGNGILHCNACGCSSHFGVEVNVPTIGCSKNIFAVDGINKFMINDIKKEFREKNAPKGTSVPLVGKSGRVWGHALKSGTEGVNPLIVSVGHRVSIETAVKVANACSVSRVPEPIRYVDKKSRKLIKDYVKKVKMEGGGK